MDLRNFNTPCGNIETVLNIILRLPALFVFETWYKYDPELALQSISEYVAHVFIAYFVYYSFGISVLAVTVIPLKILVTIYTYLITTFICYGAYLLSKLYLEGLQAVQIFCVIFAVIIFVVHTLNMFNSVLHVDLSQLQITLTKYIRKPVILIVYVYLHAVKVSAQFVIFWICLFTSKMIVIFKTKRASTDDPVFLMLLVLGECSATPLSILAFSITISYMSYYVLTLTKIFLHGWFGVNRSEEYFMALYNGFVTLIITMTEFLPPGLEPVQRGAFVYVLLIVMLSSNMYSMYRIADPVLLELSSSNNRSLNKHFKVLAFCTMLCVLPLYLAYAILQYLGLSIMPIAITSRYVLTSFNMTGSLLVYCIYLYDIFKTETWERLDDIVYYIQSTMRVSEFMVKVFTILYIVMESFVQWRWFNAVMVILLCYEVWDSLKKGWKEFLRRRQTVTKIESLKEASPEQLSNYNDVCAICYRSLNSARITACGHYFHGCCLKKWLNINDACPLCHQQINVHKMGILIT
ncbi:hypothetical protein ACF0H5_021009 [Mactra antiquata]